MTSDCLNTSEKKPGKPHIFELICSMPMSPVMNQLTPSVSQPLLLKSDLKNSKTGERFEEPLSWKSLNSGAGRSKVRPDSGATTVGVFDP